MNILISAYACNPLATLESYPGEAIVGWNLVRQLSRFHYLSVITREYNRTTLEEAKEKGKIKNVDFYYIEFPNFIEDIKGNFFGFRIYYWLWQIKAFFLAKELHRENNFDVAHQITFNNDWMPSYIGAYLPLPFIWGPAGGGQKVPPVFYPELSLGDKLREISRSISQEFWRHTPTRLLGMKKAWAVLVCNRETRKKVELFSNNVYNFPVNGVSMDDLISVKTQESKLGFRDSDLGFSSQANHPNDKTDKQTNSLTHQPTNSPTHQQTNPLTDQRLFRVICTARLVYWKGVTLGIRAFSIFHRNYPDSVFEIIGEGPDVRRINREIEKLGIRKSVNLIPWLPRDELLKRMQKAGVFLYPSLREGGGAVVVEAMASGIPVICLDLAGPGFHIKDEWGIKIEPKNPDYVVKEMAKALERLYLSEDLRREMGRRGRERAEEYYLWDKLGERLQRIYEEVLGGRD